MAGRVRYGVSGAQSLLRSVSRLGSTPRSLQSFSGGLSSSSLLSRHDAIVLLSRALHGGMSTYDSDRQRRKTDAEILRRLEYRETLLQIGSTGDLRRRRFLGVSTATTRSTGIVDVNTMRLPRRSLSSSTPAGKDESKAQALTIREAFHSPRNFGKYTYQLGMAIVNAVQHFWTGCKLLAADVRLSAKIMKKMVLGKSISRRERNILVGTGADLARLLPFSFFMIVPFMEFALPFALRLFPSMLPSQFQPELKKEEDAKKQLKVRLEIAKYFQDVVAERARTVRDSSAKEEIRKEAEDLSKFLDAIRSGGEVEEREVFRFARFFNDELTIDGAVRYLGLATYGSDAILRFKIRSKLNSIKNDDMQIMWEGGVDSLTDEEVLKACQDRGIRTMAVSKRKQRRQLSDWLAMSQDREVPSILMILSRAFFYTDMPENALKETLSSLPDDVLTDIKVAADRDMTSAERLVELKRQERLIAMEEAHQERSESERKERSELERKERTERDEEEDASRVAHAQAQAQTLAADPVPTKGELGSRVDSLKDAVEAEESVLREGAKEGVYADVPPIEPRDDKDSKEVMRIADILEALVAESPVEQERLELEGLKAELLDLEARITDDGVKSDSQVLRLKNLIAKLEREFEKTQRKVGLKMRLLDSDKDGLIHIDEVLRAVNLIAGEKSEASVKQVLSRLDENNDGVFKREDLKRLRRELKAEVGQVIEESAS